MNRFFRKKQRILPNESLPFVLYIPCFSFHHWLSFCNQCGMKSSIFSICKCFFFVFLSFRDTSIRWFIRLLVGLNLCLKKSPTKMSIMHSQSWPSTPKTSFVTSSLLSLFFVHLSCCSSCFHFLFSCGYFEFVLISIMSSLSLSRFFFFSPLSFSLSSFSSGHSSFVSSISNQQSF